MRVKKGLDRHPRPIMHRRKSAAWSGKRAARQAAATSDSGGGGWCHLSDRRQYRIGLSTTRKVLYNIQTDHFALPVP
jgi:hypothetical protein